MSRGHELMVLHVEPLYSTAWRSSASRVVARKLGLVPFGCDWKIT